LNFLNLNKKELFWKIQCFSWGKRKLWKAFFLGENFSISENDIITVEAAKVLTMYGISHDAMMP
jgi:hypothetical protein